MGALDDPIPWLTSMALPVAVSAPRGAGRGVVSRLRFRRGDAINLHRLKTPVRRRGPAEVAQKRHQHVAIRVLVDVGRMARRLDIGLAAAQVGEMALAQPVEQVPPHAGLARVNVGHDHLRHFLEAAVGAVGEFGEAEHVEAGQLAVDEVEIELRPPVLPFEDILLQEWQW